MPKIMDTITLVGDQPSRTGTPSVLIRDEKDRALLVVATGAPPSAKKGYALGCEFINRNTGERRVNTGTTSSCNFTGPNVGANANTSGSAPAISSTRTAVSRWYGDDGGVAIAATGSVPDYRVTLARMLFTYTQASSHIRSYAAMGHVKSYDAMWDEEQVAGVYGYMELYRSAATVSYGGYGKSAAVMGCVETTGTMTVAANHTIAGLAAISKLTSGLTQTGKTVGVLVDIYDVTNWSDGTSRSKWKYGIYVAANAVTEGARFGELSSSADGSGIALSASQTAALRVHADTGGAALAASNTRAALFRYLIGYAPTGGGDTSMYGAECLVKSIAAVNTIGNQGGVLGHFESQGTVTLTGSINTVRAGVASFLDLAANATVAANTVVSAFGVNPANFGTTMNGRSAIIHVTNPMAGTWGSFLDLSNATGCTQDSAAGATGGKFLKVYLNGVLYTIAMVTA